MISGLKVENLDYLVLIIGVIDELGLVELLDALAHPIGTITPPPVKW